MTSIADESPHSAPFAARAAAGVLRALCILAIIASVALLAATGYLILARESTWLPPPLSHPGESADERNARAFFQGTIGTEVVPLPVLKVLPEICDNPDGRPSHFYPFGKAAGSWIEQFGFLPSSMSPESIPPDPLAKDLPLGFTVSHYRPKSGAPSPIVFVGLACATCHTTRINGKLVIGTGNTSLNLFGWIDAFQAALKDERVTYDTILSAHEKNADNPPLSLEEKGMIWLWLNGARAKQAEDATKFDEPWGNGLSMLPENVPTGPCRTQPFRTLVRTLLHRPGADLKVYTKIAAVYQEGMNDWGQFDGGIHGLYPRSAGAALAAGATPQNLSLPEIADNVKWASDYISEHAGPTWNQIFPEKPVDSLTAEKGKVVYLAHCDSCHGHPEQGRWVAGEKDGKLTLLEDIKTDPQRVTFRGFEEVPDVLATYFPKNHPFQFAREDLRPPPKKAPTDVVERGFINKRMHAMFSRTPFLHNGSVLTLAELINLEDRKPVFFRGHNDYDVDRVGLKSTGDNEHDPKDRKLYFRFDTSLPGNSNRGHDYPWSRDDVKKDQKKQASLRELLEYLKTL
jgi:mono/diheme cytochrome c family protein